MTTTLSFRGGYLEIPPGNSIPASEADLASGVFAQFLNEGRLEIVEADFPPRIEKPSFAESLVVNTAPRGLTAEELAAKQASEAAASAEVKTAEIEAPAAVEVSAQDVAIPAEPTLEPAYEPAVVVDEPIEPSTEVAAEPAVAEPEVVAEEATVELEPVVEAAAEVKVTEEPVKAPAKRTRKSA